MNAQDIWAGHDYAYVANKGRGVLWYENAERVQVRRLSKKKDYYASERARTMVEVVFLTNDGEPRKYYSGDPMVREIRARDIFMRWEEYEEEQERRHRQAKQIAEQQARERAAAEQRKLVLLEALENKGIDRNLVTSIDDYRVCLHRNQLERWLGINE